YRLVPEPGVLGLLSIGLLGIVFTRIRKSQQCRANNMLGKHFNKRGAPVLMRVLGKNNPISYATWRSVENTAEILRTKVIPRCKT
ncbi:MAG: PEP-CTERM sorting domain-containing protein, partial [Gammaproteobacteria bacterium]|nr:PEP-CTERM sorting domain-containing protein [Gammaproteobacteria bacterium]